MVALICRSLLNVASFKSYYTEGCRRTLWSAHRSIGWRLVELGSPSQCFRDRTHELGGLVTLLFGRLELYVSSHWKPGSRGTFCIGDDNASTSWNPTPVQTTIEFRGMQVRRSILVPSTFRTNLRKATYTFPVGVTTLWWFGRCSISVLSGRVKLMRSRCSSENFIQRNDCGDIDRCYAAEHWREEQAEGIRIPLSDEQVFESVWKELNTSTITIRFTTQTTTYDRCHLPIILGACK